MGIPRCWEHLTGQLGQPGCRVTLFSSPSPPSTLSPDQQLPRAPPWLLFVHLPPTLAAPCCTKLPPALAAAHPSPQPWLWPNWALRAPCIAAFPSREGWGALSGVSHCSPLPAAFVQGTAVPLSWALPPSRRSHTSPEVCNVSIL